MVNVDVAIIGAGFSGLQAALDVQNAGFSVAVIEAQNYIGGKSLTRDLSSSSGIVELGPTWINNVTQPRVQALVDKYGLETAEQYLGGLSILYTPNGVAHSSKYGDFPTDVPLEELAKLQELSNVTDTESQKFDLENPGNWIGGEPPSIADVSFEDYMLSQGIEPGSFGHTQLTAASRALYGLDPSQIGMHFHLDYLKQGQGWLSLTSDHIEGAQYLKINEGVSKITQRMAEELPEDALFLESPVTQIVQENTGVTLHTKNNLEVKARKLVLTAPSHTYTNIDFIPALPRSKRELATRTTRGRYAKTVLTYRSPWWREAGLLGVFSSVNRGPFTTSWDNTRPEQNVSALALFSCGKEYDTLFSRKTTLERQKAMLDYLAEIVGSAIGKNVTDKAYDVVEYLEQEWYEKPYIEGAPVAAMGPGDYVQLAPVLTKVVGHIHFAGTETASIWKGYLEGAVQAGERAAKEVVGALKGNAAA
ncbi:hypothetical protein FB567DRAFT_174764 [Paraphoma chrysanthemicola]|uniref:Amine oxidase n=1 Tax=Paraphoma chrysanthemicola TaxID=798071 RepID=A0A8K0RHN1_9PLEO|nr:hypothetical protein FB567DRAFT_174764 [Paraphoma chrysanthemicola]